jgi:hypothetical protein
MSYYDVFAPLCVSDPSLLFVCGRVDAIDSEIVDTYAAADMPVADVAGAFQNGDLPAAAGHVCASTWFCALGDVHANTAGYGVIAQAFEHVVRCPTRRAAACGRPLRPAAEFRSRGFSRGPRALDFFHSLRYE